MLGDDTAKTELDAATRYIRRRRLGHYRTKGKAEDFYEKDLAALARAGFSYDVAKKALKVAS